MGAVSVVVGILAAMAFPSMAGMQGRNQLKGTMSEVKGAFREAQRNAIKKGTSCEVTITPSPPAITATPAGCISSSINFPNGVSITEPTSVTTVTFTYKGNVATAQTVVLDSTKTVDDRCLEIAAGLGLMRSGLYSSGACNTSF